jgi:hypothetical protein
VLGESVADLASVGVTPGAWDDPNVPVTVWQVEFNFACVACNDPKQILYNVKLIEVKSGDGEIVRKFYPVITLEQLNKLEILLSHTSGMKLTGTTIPPTALNPEPMTNVNTTTVHLPSSTSSTSVVSSSMLIVTEKSQGVFTLEEMATSVNVTMTPVYEVDSAGTWKLPKGQDPPETVSTFPIPMQVTDAPAGVPEPGVGVGLGSGLAGLLALRRLRRRPQRFALRVAGSPDPRAGSGTVDAPSGGFERS